MKIFPFLLCCLSAVTLIAQPNNILRGNITYQNTGDPVKGVKVMTLDGSISCPSDDNGVFSLIFPGKKPGDVVELMARLSGYEVVGRTTTNSFAEAIRNDAGMVVRVVMVKTVDKKKREDELRATLNASSEKQQQKLDAILDRLDDPGLSINERQTLQDSIAQLNKSIEALAANQDELVKRIAETDLSQASDMVKQAFAEFDKGNIKKALALLPGDQLDAFMKKAQQAFDLGVENYMVKARFLIADNQYEAAKENYMKAVGADSMNLDNLWEVAYFLNEQNDFKSAIHYYNKAISIARTEEVRASLLNNLGLLHSDNSELSEAEVRYVEALTIYRALAKVNPQTYLPYVAIPLNNLANLHSDNNELTNAEAEYGEALDIRRALAEANPQAYLPDVAATLNNLALLHSDNNELSKAEAEYGEALKTYRSLAEANPQAYLPDVAMTLNNLAALHSDNNERTKAEAEYGEALKTYRSLAEANPQAYLPDVAMTLNNLAILHYANNELTKAEAEYGEALNIRRALAEANPQAYLPDVATTMNNLAVLHYANNELWQAEAEFGEALKIRRALADANPQAYLPYVAGTLNNLANLHSDNNEQSKAEAEYGEALKIYRALAEANPQAYLSGVAETLNNLAVLHYANNEWSKAEAEYGEALNIRRDLAEANPKAYNLNVFMTEINLAILHKDMLTLSQDMRHQQEALALLEDAAGRLAIFPKENPTVMDYQKRVDYLKHYFQNFISDEEWKQKYLSNLTAFEGKLAMLDSLTKENEAETNPLIKLNRQKEIVQLLEDMTKESLGSHLLYKLAPAYGALAWYHLFVHGFQEAQAAAEKCLAIDPAQDWVNSNLSLALLYQGKWPEAKAIYEKYKGHAYDDERGWTQVFLQDLDDLEAAGITHPDVAKARELLKE